MRSDMDRWPGDSDLKEVISEFWGEFSTLWAALKTTRWPEFGSANRADEDFFRIIEGLHHTTLSLNALIRSLSDYLSNHTSVAKDSDFASLVAFVHDLRAPVAATCGFSELGVVRGFKDEASFLQWRSLMMESLTRIDRVIADNTTFFAHKQSTS